LADATVACLVLQCGGGGLELVNCMPLNDTITQTGQEMDCLMNLFLRRSASTAHIYTPACVCISPFSKRGRLATF
jgi:hypothetical protein